MNIEQEIKELRVKLDELEEQVKEKNITGRYIPKYLQEYFYLISDGDVFKNTNTFTDTDTCRISIGNCSKTREQAEKYRRILINTQKLKDLADRLNDGKEIDWSTTNNQTKYFLGVHTFNTLKQYKNWDTKIQSVVYCLDESFIDKAIEEIGEESLIELIKGK